MGDGSTWQEHWREIEAEEVRLLRDMSVSEGLRTFAILWDAFRSRFQAEEEGYLREREAALIERQQRLVRLAEWLAAAAG